ncbi:hypothetical protein LSH36_261g00037 [Paralvinella palmiformis]|uniref:Integrase zinc-binding domain-containing protein n=1 Tax=Paralvinella palmiformis TaxID=53620 RepID=A0AAD9JM97_9ANNE|nr:hypothetical protein LSH36_261g00037 [Paralvinella palmiformis]
MKLLEGRLGINKWMHRTGQSLWWPGMGCDLQQYVSQCQYCSSTTLTQHTEPLKATPLPAHPWQSSAADLYVTKGNK